MNHLNEGIDLIYYRADGRPHIRVRGEVCSGCTEYRCVNVCPAGCYLEKDNEPGISFQYERCLECGTCRLVCGSGAIEWAYPRGGKGVIYRFT